MQSEKKTTTKPILTYKEYESIVQKELDEYYEMIDEFRKQYIDFKDIEKYMGVEPMNYIDYCEFNGYQMEYKDDDLKKLF